jgi:hypothetical protein
MERRSPFSCPWPNGALWMSAVVDERSQTLILGEKQPTFLNNAPRSGNVHFCAPPQESQSILHVDAREMRARSCMPRLLPRIELEDEA